MINMPQYLEYFDHIKELVVCCNFQEMQSSYTWLHPGYSFSGSFVIEISLANKTFF